MIYNTDAHELRAQAFLQAIKGLSAWAKQVVSVMKNQLQGLGLSHTA